MYGPCLIYKSICFKVTFSEIFLKSSTLTHGKEKGNINNGLVKLVKNLIRSPLDYIKPSKQITQFPNVALSFNVGW